MRVQRQLTITVPIPPSLPPYVVVAYLQTIIPVIRHLGTLSRYEAAASRVGDVADDPFFVHGGENVSSYQIYEVITLAPGLTKEVTYPTYWQCVAGGLRCRANGAAGITGWAEFTVRPARRDHGLGSSPDAASTPSTVSEMDEYEVHESLLVEANSLLMPFVVHTMEVAHRDLCRKVIEEAAQAHYYGGSGSGTSPLSAALAQTPQDPSS